MSALNILIDGTWLLVQCAAGQSLANATDQPESRFILDFEKLNQCLLSHAQVNGGNCDRIGESHIVTSIFTLPPDFDDWPNRFDDMTSQQIERLQRAVNARDAFVQSATNAGYSTDAVFRPPIREHIMRRLEEKRYQEKQVDTAVVALLVRSAITKPGDYHVVITGDSDILPAIRVAYPQFTKNVFVATTHPDELDARHRQRHSHSLSSTFDTSPLYAEQRKCREAYGW